MKLAVTPAGVQNAKPIQVKVEGDKIVEGKGISELLVKGTLIPGVWNGGNHLIDMANTATPDQLASILQSHHLVNNPAAAHDQAQSVLAEVQSKGGNAFLFGGLAGALAFVVVDIAKPKLQLEIKLAIAAVVFVLVASLMYWGFNDEPQKPGDKATTPKAATEVR